MLKIYFNQKPLIVTGQITKEVEKYMQKETTLLIDQYNADTMPYVLQKMEEDTEAVIIITDRENEVLGTLKEQLTLVQAAGGFVYTPDGDVLLIFRRGKWDLPKGKLDEAEELEECAVREVEEETGLSAIHLNEKLLITYHTYYEKTVHILKETHWYLMRVDQQQELIPQTDEDIEKCEWISLHDLASYNEKTHQSIIDVFNKAINVLKENKNI
jgi:8-oxo-dGTP pyrophosphatase MutT (NUDIX family)